MLFAFVAVATTFAAFQYRNCNLLQTGTRNKIVIQQKNLRHSSSVKLSGAVIAVVDSEFAKNIEINYQLRNALLIVAVWTYTFGR